MTVFKQFKSGVKIPEVY